MRIIGAYLKPYTRQMILGVAIKFLGTLMDLLIPWLLAHIVDTLMPRGHTNEILLFGLLMALCSVVAITFNVGANRMAAKSSCSFSHALRRDLFDHIMHLSAAERDRYATSSLVSRLTNDTYNVHQLVEKMQRLGIRAPLLVLGGILFSFLLEPHLAVILALMAPLLALVVRMITKKGIPLYAKVTERIDVLVRIVRENAIGVRVIKALSKSGRETLRFGDANEALKDVEQRAGTLMAATGPVMNFLLNTGFVLVLLYGAFRVNLGLTQPGKIMAFLSYFTIILNAVLSVMKIFTIWSRGSASAQRIAAVMDTPAAMDQSPPDHMAGCPFIVFDGVGFSYKGCTRNLEDISFTLEKGQTLGIIGPTGSGKTTLVNLLLRFYAADEGCIRIEGDDIAGIPPGELRKRFGAAFQNDVLLAESVYENISFLRGIPRDQVERAAKTAQIDEFIRSLPAGYDTPVDIRGANLSGGQKQRLLIARALAAGPEILVLDDAQSALDYQTDAALRRAIRRDYPDTTTVIVSQRVASIMHADLLLLIIDGKLAGAGVHNALMAQSEDYRRIVQIQTGGGPL